MLTPQEQTTSRLRDGLADHPLPCSEQSQLFFEPDTFAHRLEPHAVRRMRERSAKALCTSCPVRELCLELARREQPTAGVWGGFTHDEIRSTTQEEVA